MHWLGGTFGAKAPHQKIEHPSVRIINKLKWDRGAESGGGRRGKSCTTRMSISVTRFTVNDPTAGEEFTKPTEEEGSSMMMMIGLPGLT